MTQLTKLLLGALAAPLALPAIASAQAAGGVAVADLQGAMQNTKAFQTAFGQVRAANATAISQIQARNQSARTELQPLVTKFQADQRANVASATLQSEAATIQARQNAAQADINRLEEPLQRAEAYELEQMQPKLQQAVNAAMAAHGVTMLVKPDAVAYISAPTSDLTGAITAQLDTLVPSINANPPAGWQPGQTAAGAPAVATPTPATGGRRSSGGR